MTFHLIVTSGKKKINIYNTNLRPKSIAIQYTPERKCLSAESTNKL